jgi:hypothetical protein
MPQRAFALWTDRKPERGRVWQALLNVRLTN